MGRNIINDNALAGISGGAAGANTHADFHPFDGFTIKIWQARSGRFVQMFTLLIQQHNAAQQVRIDIFDTQHDVFEQRLKREIKSQQSMDTAAHKLLTLQLLLLGDIGDGGNEPLNHIIGSQLGNIAHINLTSAMRSVRQYQPITTGFTLEYPIHVSGGSRIGSSAQNIPGMPTDQLLWLHSKNLGIGFIAELIPPVDIEQSDGEGYDASDQTQLRFIMLQTLFRLHTLADIDLRAPYAD